MSLKTGDLDRTWLSRIVQKRGLLPWELMALDRSNMLTVRCVTAKPLEAWHDISAEHIRAVLLPQFHAKARFVAMRNQLLQMRQNILDANHYIDLDITKVPHVACPEWKRQGIACHFCHARFNFLTKSEKFHRKCHKPSKLSQRETNAWLGVLQEQCAKLNDIITKLEA